MNCSGENNLANQTSLLYMISMIGNRQETEHPPHDREAGGQEPDEQKNLDLVICDNPKGPQWL